MKNLLKYELRSIGRKLLPLYVAVLVLSVVGAISLGNFTVFANWSPSFFSIVSTVGNLAYFGLLVGTYAVTLQLVLTRFYHGVLGDEGYLVHTLPLPTHTIIWSKLLSGALTFACTGILTLLSWMILLSSALFHQIPWLSVYADFSRHMPLFPLMVFEGFLFMIASLLCGVSLLYLSMAIGHLANKHRILMSFLAYMGISTLLNILSAFVFDLYARLGWLDGLLYAGMHSNYPLLIHASIWIGIASSVLVLVGSMLSTTWLVKHKLNLE